MSTTKPEKMPLQDQPQDQMTTRRDFIHILAGATAVGGAAATAIPLIHQMNPDASVRALATKEVDVSSIEVGQAVKIMWQGKPVFIRRRTLEEIEQARNIAVNKLKDTDARNKNLAASDVATDENRVQKAEWLVIEAACTHLGCIPLGTSAGDVRGDYNGWFCPCHGSHYDTAGRIRKGPAPENLPIPPYEFLSDTRIKIG